MPESSRISVFMNGVCQASNVCTPAGGHIGVVAPATCSGKSAKLKNAQKKPTKNITSEAMNSVMP